MDLSRKNAIIIMIVGVVLVAVGFLSTSHIGAILVQVGILLIFGPLMLAGFNIRDTNKTLGNAMILVSLVFLFAIVISLVGTVMMFFVR